MGTSKYGRALASLALAAASAQAQTVCTNCAAPLQVCPIPTLRVHRDFPVNYRATHSWSGCANGFSYNWQRISGPAEFNLDGAGGLFYWTPAATGTFPITIRIRTFPNEEFSDTETFTAIVDDNTMTYPVWRDYLEEATNVGIRGRATGAGAATFVSYLVQYAQVTVPDPPPPPLGAWVTIAGPITTPVPATGPLADWNIAGLPNGGRYLLRLVVNLSDGSQSIVENQAIIDRTAKPGWPVRTDGPFTHSPVMADLDDDGIMEVLAVTHFGELYVFDIAGNQRAYFDANAATYTAPSVGDIDGDGRPEIVWTTSFVTGASRLWAHRPDGSLVPGFPVLGPANRVFRTVPTLADLDGDGRLDIIVGAQGAVSGVNGQVLAYRYNTSPGGGSVALLPGWPRDVGHPSVYASASVGDLDLDNAPEVVVEAFDRAYAWHADGSPVAGWGGGAGVLLAANITGAETNGAGSFNSSSQPAIADLNLDGSPEVVIGSNILRADGARFPGWENARAGATNALSAAIGELDGIPANGLEIVLGRQAWRTSGTSLPGFPLPQQLAPAALGDPGNDAVGVIAGVRGFATPPGVFTYTGQPALWPTWPKSLYGNTGDAGAPVVGDFDDDGLVDIAAAITDSSYGGVIAIWNEPWTNQDEHHHWPMLGHDARHTGRYTDPPPNAPRTALFTVAGAVTRVTWHDTSEVESHFVIERSQTGAPWSFVYLGQAPAGAQLFVDDSPLGPGAAYRVRAARTDAQTGALLLSRFAPAGPDCNGNGVADASDIASGDSRDENGDGVPDECACPADLDQDGTLTSADFFDYLNAFFAAPPLPRADFNHDTRVTSQDFFDFLTAFFAGCP